MDKPKNKINKIVIIVLVIIIFSVLLIIKKCINFDTYKIGNDELFAKEELVENKDYFYEIAVDFIKNKFHDLNTRREQSDYQVMVSYEKFGITKDNKYYYIYMWVLSESYYVDDNTLYRGRSNSSLYKISLKDDKVIEYDMPGNEESLENAEYYHMKKTNTFLFNLKEICFNEEIYNKIMDYEINLSNEDKVSKHYSYLSDLSIHYQSLGSGNSSDSKINSPNSPNRKSNSSKKRRRR